jgi:hypothetical protein
VKDWLQSLKLGEWSKWMTGQGPMPDRRSQVRVGGVLAVAAVLVIGLALASGDLGSSPAKRSAGASAGRWAFTPNATVTTTTPDSDSSDSGTSSDSGNSSGSSGSGNSSTSGNSSAKDHSSAKGNSSNSASSPDSGASSTTTTSIVRTRKIYTRADRRAAKKAR